MSDRKDSTRIKYSLLGYEGKLANELKLQKNTNFPMMISHEDLDRINLGNLSTYTYSIKNDRVKNWLKSLVFSYKREVEMSFDEKNK